MAFFRRCAGILPFAGLATLVAHRLLQSPTTGVDDADIFLAYARNLSSGHGFVFNAGGERVEGFTSLLWVLVCTATTAVTDSPERILLALTIALTIITATACLGSIIVRRTGRNSDLSCPWAAAFVVLLLSDFRFIAWNTVTLMDTSLWTCLLTASALCVLNDRAAPQRQAWSLAALNAALILARPEALLWTPLLTVLFLFARATSMDRPGLVRLVTPPIASIVATVALLTAFRLSYFGYPLPNTFYAKVSPSLTYTLTEGLAYLSSYVRSGLVVQTCVLALCASTAHVLKVGLKDRRTLTLTVLTLAGLAVPVIVGGDHFGGFRFYQSVYPLMVLTLLNCLRFIAPRYIGLPANPLLRRAVSLGGAAVLGAWFVIAQMLAWTDPTQRAGLLAEFEIAARGREAGRAMATLFAGDERLPSVATITVGGLKHGYPGEIVDLMGLNNTRMAHNGGARLGYRSHAAFEKQTFYELRPMVLVPHSQSTGEQAWKRTPFVDGVLKGLLDDRQFRETYRLAAVRRTTPRGVSSVVAWYDIGFLETLARSKRYEIYFEPSAAARFARSGVIVQ